MRSKVWQFYYKKTIWHRLEFAVTKLKVVSSRAWVLPWLSREYLKGEFNTKSI